MLKLCYTILQPMLPQGISKRNLAVEYCSDPYDPTVSKTPLKPCCIYEIAEIAISYAYACYFLLSAKKSSFSQRLDTFGKSQTFNRHLVHKDEAATN